MIKLKSHCVAAPMATFKARRRAVGISLAGRRRSDTARSPVQDSPAQTQQGINEAETYLTRIQHTGPQPNWKKTAQA